MKRAKRELYKGVLLPDTVPRCRWLIRKQIDQLEMLRLQLARPGGSGEPAIIEEPMLRVPKVEGEG